MQHHETKEPPMAIPATSAASSKSVLIGLWKLLTVGSVILCGLTMTGFLARYGWLFELTSHFRVQYAIGITAAVGFFLLAKRWRWSALLLVFGSINWALVVPIYFSSEPTPVAAKTFRVLWLNVNAGNEQYTKIMQVIRKERPDFVFLAEMNRRLDHGLSDLREEYPYSHKALREDNFGLVLLSRHPFEEVAVYKLGEHGLGCFRVCVADHESPFTLFAAHVLPPISPSFSAGRNEQLRQLGELVSAQPTPNLVVGDLNITPWSPFFHDLLRKGKLRDSRQSFGIQTTWPDHLSPFWIPIDHCLVSGGIHVHERRVVGSSGSDHCAIVVDFSVD